jgi:hypothetical protein
MTQTLYAHMNKIKILKNNNYYNIVIMQIGHTSNLGNHSTEQQ